jgi:glycosyltransferase involved in cell wall biosynthesis
MNTNRKKILIVGKNPPPLNGTTVWFEALQKSDWSENFELIYFNNNIHKKIETLGKFSFSSIIKNIQLYFKFQRFLTKEKPHLTLLPISQTTLGFIKDSIYIYISKRCNKTLLILHGGNWVNWINNSSKITRKYVKNSIKKTEGIIVLGKSLTYLFKDFFPTNKIFIAENGIDIPTAKSLNEKDETTINLLYLGNLQESKGVKKLIEVIEHLNSTNYVLNVVGKWYDEKTKQFCLDKINSKQMKILFQGEKKGDEKHSFFEMAAIFIFLPQEQEGMPLTIIEAMAYGLPIVTVNKGAIKECVLNEQNGFIFDNDNTREISAKIDYLIENKTQRDRMSLNSKEFYEQRFTKNHMIKRYTKIFNDILNESNRKNQGN